VLLVKLLARWSRCSKASLTHQSPWLWLVVLLRRLTSSRQGKPEKEFRNWTPD